jgi:type IV pilus assembly protein PilQ
MCLPYYAFAIPATSLEKINVEILEKKLKLTLMANGDISDYLSFELTNPARLVIDFPFDKCKLPRVYQLKNKVYPRIRWGIFKGKLRVVVDCSLKRLPFYKIETEGDKLKLWLNLQLQEKQPIVKITAVEFEKISPSKCRLSIKTSSEVQYEVFYKQTNTMVLKLNNAQIPTSLCRELDTKYFPCGIEKIIPYRLDNKTVVIEIKFKYRVPFKVVSKQHYLYLTFTTKAKTPVIAKPEDIKPQLKNKIEKNEIEKQPQKLTETKPQPSPVKPKAKLVSPFFGKETQEPIIILPGTIAVFKGTPLSLDFQDADLKNVFRILAEVSGLNIIVGENVKGKVTLKLTNVPWDQVLDLLLETYRLGAIKKGKVLRILTMDDIKREQELIIQTQQALERKKESEPLITEEIQINYVNAADLIEKLKDIKSSRGKLICDEKTNRIIITDVKERIERAKRLIHSLDIIPKQVMIEARIVEVNTDYSKELGIQWGADYQHVATQSNFLNFSGEAGEGDEFSFENPATGESTSGNIPLIVNLPPGGVNSGLGFTLGHLGTTTTLILDAKLQAMESKGEGKIISVPKVITMNNQKAHIKQGITMYLPHTDENGRTTFEPVNADLKLDVTPQVTPNNKILLNLLITKNSIGTIQPGMGSPPVEEKEIQTTLLVDNNETIVIGGILSEEVRKGKQNVPFFSRLPILGWAFQNKVQQKQKRELLIFITPRILEEENF